MDSGTVTETQAASFVYETLHLGCGSQLDRDSGGKLALRITLLVGCDRCHVVSINLRPEPSLTAIIMASVPPDPQNLDYVLQPNDDILGGRA